MPELPDLQVFSENLKKKITGRTILTVNLFQEKRIDESEENIRNLLIGTSITEIQRIGKELNFKLGNGQRFFVHLMLSGKFQICKADDISDIKWKIIALMFDDGQALVITDHRGLCKITFHPAAEDENIPDALSIGFTYEYLQSRAKESGRKNIKAFLTDQGIIKGIGSAYADEILWKANISPESVTGKIPEIRLMDLYRSVSTVLQNAILNIEKASPGIIGGEERGFLNVHNAHKQYTDGGDRILMKKIGSRTTYFTEKQELFQ